jgi:hypothetical protein
MQNFYNTTNETGQQLDLFERDAKAQEDIILEAFIKKQTNLSPEVVWEQCFHIKHPLNFYSESDYKPNNQRFFI